MNQTKNYIFSEFVCYKVFDIFSINRNLKRCGVWRHNDAPGFQRWCPAMVHGDGGGDH